MGEKRKCNFYLLLDVRGKETVKVEFFNSKLWGVYPSSINKATRYRIRVAGRWYPKPPGYRYLTFWEARDLYWKAVARMI